MRWFASDAHRAHHALELDGSEVIPSWEGPDRAETVAAAVAASGRHQRHDPLPYDAEAVARVHDPGYLDFLAHAWDDWVASGEQGAAAMGGTWPARRMASAGPPASIRGRLGWYGFAADCSITAGTWPAAQAAAALAQSATAAVIGGERAAFALCRPPGHHATVDQFGGYCYLNNAAIAAQQLVEAGAARVAVVDVDYHHGNGSQDIFWERSDVFTTSIHADPAEEFPYFVGFAHETGAGAGAGHHRNVPLPCGTGPDVWFAALDDVLDDVAHRGCDALVVSLGVDTFELDPISTFRLTTEHYPVLGARLAAAGLPTVFVMEGGYAVAALGANVAGVLDGFDEAVT